MNIRKAVITAAGAREHHLPLQTLVDRDGQPKTVLAILLEELAAARVEEIGVVVRPGDEAPYTAAAGPAAGRLRFLVQPEPRGYGHAVLCAREFVGADPFLLLVGDHLYVQGASPRRCAEQLVEIAAAENAAVSAVQPTHESKLPYYGAVGGRVVSGRRGLYQVTEVLEKPTPTEAEQRLVVPGLRAGYYLCFFGMHVLTPAVFTLLEAEQARLAPGERLQLSPALAALARQEKYLAAELAGRRYDLGARYGLLTAQLALALEGRDREEVLSLLVELLANRVR
jgi:UTP--glucose-1-phosphate uridylyltransferase